MENVHSILLIKRDNKYLVYYNENWKMYLFPNIEGNNIEEIKKKYNVNKVKYLFDVKHKKYSVPHKEEREYHHYFYLLEDANVSGDYYTLDELLEIPEEQKYNLDIIEYIKEYENKNANKNKKLIESLFKEIEKLGYHIINKQYTNHYFVFEYGSDTICSFKIKEIKGYRFGLWSISNFDTLEHQKENKEVLWSDEYKISSKTQLVFFVQYEENIDKFKPSRSGFVKGLYKSNNKWQLDELQSVLEFMKKHKFKTYYYVTEQLRDIEEETNGIRCFIEYMKNYLYHEKEKFINKCTRIYVKHLYKKFIKNIDKYYNILLEDFGENFYPALHFYIQRKPNFDIKNNECIKAEDYIDKFEYKYIKYFSINQYDLDLKYFENKSKEIQQEVKYRQQQFRQLVTVAFFEKAQDEEILYCNCESFIDPKLIEEE